MPGLPRDLDHQAVRETERRLAAELSHRSRNSLVILQSQLLMTKQHFDSLGLIDGTKFIDTIEYPDRFREGQDGDPPVLGDETIR